jgi:hypothetical protein
MISSSVKTHTISKENLILEVKGIFTSESILQSLEIAEKKLDILCENNSTKKKLFNILVESLQNLYHHAEPYNTENNHIKNVEILVWRNQFCYYIKTENYIRKENINSLRTQIETVNSLSKSELRDYYKFSLKNNSFSAKGGANLGLIDIARKSGEKLEYNFRNVNNDVSIFELKIKVQK